MGVDGVGLEIIDAFSVNGQGPQNGWGDSEATPDYEPLFGAWADRSRSGWSLGLSRPATCPLYRIY